MPMKAIIQNTLPRSMFQVRRHMFTSMAIPRIPVRMPVHTIKISPNVPHCRKTRSKFHCHCSHAAYALLFGIQSYSSKMYISLLLLTISVMLAGSFDVSKDMIGLTCAFGSVLVFVSSNISLNS
jgi:solute carrier family 35 protein E1